MKKIPTFNQLYKMAPAGIQKLLDKCADIPQSPSWHPEGDVLKHIRIVYERAKKTGDFDIAIAALFHDLGKIKATKKNKHGGWSAYGHEFISTDIVDENRKWIKEIGGDFDKIKNIVLYHMKVKQMEEMRPHKREALKNNPFFKELQEFTKCDNMQNLTKDEMQL